MNTEKNTENLNLISKLSISLYEDKEIERLIIERDSSPIGVAKLILSLIANANSEVVRETISTMEFIICNFKQYTKAHTIQVNLKPEIIAQIDDTAIAHLHIKTSENTSTLKKWMRYGSEKLTHYSFLIALSEVFSLPVEDLVEIHRS